MAIPVNEIIIGSLHLFRMLTRQFGRKMPPNNIGRSRSLPSRLKRSNTITYGSHIDDFSIYHNDYEDIYSDQEPVQATQQVAQLSAALRPQYNATVGAAEQGSRRNDLRAVDFQLRAIAGERRALADDRRAIANERLAIADERRAISEERRAAADKQRHNLPQIEEAATTDRPGKRVEPDRSRGKRSKHSSSSSTPSSTESSGVTRWLPQNNSWQYILESSARLQPVSPNSNLVGWDVDDPLNPKNRSPARKWTAVFIVSSFNLITPISSSMVAPALPQIARDLHISSDIEKALVLSIFLLAYAVGPLIFGPLSEVYGRVPVLQLANFFYLVTNLACGFAQSSGVLLAFRFLSGVGGSAPLAIGGGVIADLFRPDERGRAVNLYTLGPLLGPVSPLSNTPKNSTNSKTRPSGPLPEHLLLATPPGGGHFGRHPSWTVLSKSLLFCSSRNHIHPSS